MLAEVLYTWCCGLFVGTRSSNPAPVDTAVRLHDLLEQRVLKHTAHSYPHDPPGAQAKEQSELLMHVFTCPDVTQLGHTLII